MRTRDAAGGGATHQTTEPVSADSPRTDQAGRPAHARPDDRSPSTPPSTPASTPDAPTARGRQTRASSGFNRATRAAVTLGAAALALGVGIGAYLVAGSLASAPPPSVEPLRVRTLEAELVDSYTVARSYVGEVRPRRRSEIGFELSGRLIELTVDDGDRVAAGERLARLDTQRLEARRQEQVARLGEAQAQAELASILHQRTRRAFDADAATARELDIARQEHRAAEAAVAAARERLDSIDVDLGKSTLKAPYDAIVAERFLDEGWVVRSGEPVFTLIERSRPEARIGFPPRAVKRLRVGEARPIVVGGRHYRGQLQRLRPVTASDTRTVEAVFALNASFKTVREGDLARTTVTRRIEESGFWLPLSALTESTRGLWACYVAEPLAAADRVSPRDGESRARTDVEPGADSGIQGEAQTIDEAQTEDDPDGERRATHRLTRRTLEVLHATEDRALVVGGLRPGEAVVAEGLHRLVVGQRVRTIERSRAPMPSHGDASERRDESPSREGASVATEGRRP